MSLSPKVRFLNFFRNVFRIAPLESVLASFTAGKPGDSFAAKLVPNPYQYKPNTIRTVRRNGVTMQVDISDYIGHWLYFGFLDENMNKLFSLCRIDSNVVDVGTNVGWTLLNMATIADRGHVFGFEPDPFNYRQCQSNLALNRRSNVSLFPIGLSDANATVTMEVRTPSNRGGNRISPTTTGHPVEVIRLDDHRPVASAPRIDVIKIDVEGHELQVLKGAAGLLERDHPVLFIELDDNNLRDQGYSAFQLIEFLEGKGYRNIVNAADGSPVNATSGFKNIHIDIIAR